MIIEIPEVAEVPAGLFPAEITEALNARIRGQLDGVAENVKAHFAALTQARDYAVQSGNWLPLLTGYPGKDPRELNKVPDDWPAQGAQEEDGETAADTDDIMVEAGEDLSIATSLKAGAPTTDQSAPPPNR